MLCVAPRKKPIGVQLGLGWSGGKNDAGLRCLVGGSPEQAGEAVETLEHEDLVVVFAPAAASTRFFQGRRPNEVWQHVEEGNAQVLKSRTGTRKQPPLAGQHKRAQDQIRERSTVRGSD